MPTAGKTAQISPFSDVPEDGDPEVWSSAGTRNFLLHIASVVNKGHNQHPLLLMWGGFLGAKAAWA